MWKEQHVANIARRWKSLPEASVDRAENLANECRTRLIDAVKAVAKDCEENLHQKLPQRSLGILLSGGVDSTAILEACQIADIALCYAVTVSIVEDQEGGQEQRIPQDEQYATEAVRIYNQAQQAKKQPNMKHRVVRLSPSELVQKYSTSVIKTLAVWGYMETRNSLIMSAALEECQKLGLTDVLTGDNADELFGGSYDWYFDNSYIHDPMGWKTKRNETANLPFVTNKLATTFGITLHQPFRESILLDWAIRETGRRDCIDTTRTCLLQSQFDGPYKSIYNCGKLPLREAFQTVASWRTMDWIFKGSGAAGPNENDDQNVPPLVAYYQNLYTDEEFQEEQAYYRNTHNIVLQSKEHLHNIRIFLKVFGGFDQHPTKQRYEVGDPRGCVSCLYDIGDEQFCHLCDEYPAQHPKKLQQETAAEYCASFDDVKEAACRIQGVAHRTPVMTCRSLMASSHDDGKTYYFKVEAIQKTGSFKFRGALNAIKHQLEMNKNKTHSSTLAVCTHSSGNHAQALALAANLASSESCKVSATIVMPESAPIVKRNAVRDFGATIVMVENTNEARQSEAQKIVKSTGAVFVHPSENPKVIAGQGTVCLEFIEQVKELSSGIDLDAVIIPVGGGGLASGNCLSLRGLLGKKVKIILAEPSKLDDAKRSFVAKKLLKHEPGTKLDSVADGLKTTLGPNTWPIVRDFVDDIITVSEKDILRATKQVWERLKVAIEPSAGVGVAVAQSLEFNTKYKYCDGIRNVGVILCGGNVDIVKTAQKMKEMGI